MKIIAFEKECPNTASQDFAPHLKAEALKVYELVQDNFIREIYFREEASLVVLILECDNLEQARIRLRDLPLVKQNLIDFELIPLKPYPGFSRLFETVTS